ncbi:ATP-dependent RNA helicase DDX54-like [Toxorhynchites rutilus septentrionalis]|uniref:ATP-dependent RNA helicase DDX54-like n=1 Tax=Toxorhynchites rutilus septentrionalis TaxID=329112 RepID=UPI002479CB70|nr:ATP-dependent RNA helicase DDX54-like [Toxorhynchites rutilus septentrionalis]XP_055621895.1 ATP-dependent RNA helicase DDX54-like [Toxorhynchites rutilus septentrionalis]XP_055622136.1 ATP-dependent RNA helicase DDX54-like [Toxorhynchites rutilus septentrionalis]XP_055629221.1 ATP-dependent RNA helicase DDX54-like [Toxorhynchites rutilus septentrionalis]XP_055629222.1 ATP-dependent RNA helicase DDX54-like [Toxorhynchites rutilus septentrionalis]
MDTEDPNIVPGFSVENVDIDFDDDGAAKKGKKKKGGGFQAMGLSMPVLKAILKMGYKMPTPIQRKAIPLIMEGRDVVAMAKTGSGKTACFLIPLFEKLKQREIKNGARALILTPTRELAIQTFKFIKQLGKFLDLKAILVLGGDSMDSQFAAIHTLPDIIVATPGRFLHLCVEMDLKLTSIQYCVFDEADRLFEMGFEEQLTDTLRRLPEARQMVLFSATLPKLMVEFAKAGLREPTLIRLDVEIKIPETLDFRFIYCRPDERYATLLVLLREVIPKNKQIVLFAGTQHHVELISLILTKAGIPNTYVFSSLDASARKINTAKFTMKKVNVLVVTDIAARGLDIPTLDYVVNVHFPGKPKLFIHRVGRCARAGRHGTAFNIFSNDDIAHMIDLNMFLSRPLDVHDSQTIGLAPPDLVEAEHQLVLDYVKHNDLATIFRVSNKAYKQYIATRPSASASSNKKAKLFKLGEMKVLEDFKKSPEKDPVVEQKVVKKATKKAKKMLESKKQPSEDPNDFRNNFLAQMKNFRPQTTIFELNPKSNSKELLVMAAKRGKDGIKIEKHKRKLEELEMEEQKKAIASMQEEKPLPKKKKQNPIKDEQHYISYQAKDQVEENGYSVNNFANEANSAELSVIGDTAADQKFHQRLQKWDRKKKKMVNVENPKAGKIRTEHGVWIAASYKTGRYDKWKERTKTDEQTGRQQQDSDGSDDESALPVQKRDYPHTHWGRHNAKMDLKKRHDLDLKSADQIVKQRMQKETKLMKEKAARMKNLQRKKKALSRRKASGKK